MKESVDIRQLWQETSQKIAETHQLTRQIIEKAIESKSNDIIAQFIREKRTGMISGALLIPVIMAGILISFPITWYSLTLVAILGLGILFGIVEGLKNLKKIKMIDESCSLQESLSQKLEFLRKNFKRGKVLAPIVGIGFYVPVMLIYRYMEYGSLDMTQNDLIVLLVSTVFIVAVSLGIIRFQQYKYIKPLEECLTELENMDPPAANTKPRINLGLVIAILLIVNLIIYVLVTILH